MPLVLFQDTNDPLLLLPSELSERLWLTLGISILLSLHDNSLGYIIVILIVIMIILSLSLL